MHPRRTLHTALASLLVATALTGCEIHLDPGTDPQHAATQLDELVVATSGSMRGYSRDRFPHWRTTGDSCNVRDSILERDGTEIRRRGCNVTGGRWFSVYDGKVLTRDEDVDIDHMVPLANAWRSGAAGWDDAKRGEFANDVDHPQLVAVSATSNRSKGDQDPSQWKPPRQEAWCTYALDWIAVKAYWKLSVTAAEKTALTEMLETCV